MTPIRSNNIYISSQLYRWLKWISDLLDETGKHTPDSIAESLLREAVLKAYPGIEKLEQDYWTARNKLDSETVNKLKEQTCHQTNPKP